jgi:hypothetical protein
MGIIIGIDHLHKILSAEQIEQIEAAAAIHQSQSNIEFTILKLEEQAVHIEAAQSTTRSGRYATEASLLKKAHEVFDKFLSGYTIHFELSPHLPSLSSIVTPAWLEMKMKEKEVRIKQIAFETGIDRESIADWVNGKRNMSQLVKAMFYFYLSR